jgi:hypothetical protein
MLNTARSRALVALFVAGLLGLTVIPAQAMLGAHVAPAAARPHVFKGVPCRLIAPAPNAAPVGTTACPGVRPGGIVRVPAGMCSLNFVFRGNDRRTYVGTAGHCVVLKAPAEKKYSGDRAPPAFDQYGRSIGNFVYGVLNDTKDFALIRLNPGVKYSPKMCHFGGPDGMYQKHEPGPSILRQYGNGIYWGDTLPARTLVAPTMIDPEIVYAVGEGGPGDSGSGVINAAGEAVGVLVAGVDCRATGTCVPGTPWLSSLMVITRLDSQLKRAQQVMKIKLTMLSATVDTNLL